MTAVGATDRGRRRKDNQDNYYINVIRSEKQALLIVCDGMGGARSGNIASDLSITIFAAEVKKRQKPSMSTAYMRSAMLTAASIANALTYEKSLESSAYSGMGSTLVAMLANDDNACILNVGDSRAYHVRNKKINRLTHDHSLAQEKIDKGELSPEEAYTHPSKNFITRAMGTEPSVNPDTFEIKIARGDIILLCSDGLSNLVEEEEMLDELLSCEDISDCPAKLIELANRRGGTDNITVVIYKK